MSNLCDYILVLVDSKTKETVKEVAKRNNLSVSSIVRLLIKRHLKQLDAELNKMQ